MLNGNCPYCNEPFRARNSSVGMLRRCEGCGQKFRVSYSEVRGCLGSIVGAIIVTFVGLLAIRWALSNFRLPAPPPSASPQPPPAAKPKSNPVLPGNTVAPVITSKPIAPQVAPKPVTSLPKINQRPDDDIAAARQALSLAKANVETAKAAALAALGKRADYIDLKAKVEAAKQAVEKARVSEPYEVPRLSQIWMKLRNELSILETTALQEDQPHAAAVKAVEAAQTALAALTSNEFDGNPLDKH